MKRIFIVAVLLLCASSVFAGQVKVACIYSKFLDYAYKPDQTQILASLGWSEDLYENIRIEELANKLHAYDMVVMNASYNWVNTQDLTKYAAQFRAYLRNGGCLVVTDANYPQQTNWLSSIEPNLIWNPSGQMTNTEGQILPWANSGHPLLQNEPNPTCPWTYPNQTSPYMTVLYKTSKGAPSAAVMEIGDGVVVVTSMYHQTGWPTSGFFTNLMNWLKDPARIASKKDREAKAKERRESLPNLDVPLVESSPVIDGKVAEGEWDGAALIPSFYDTYGRNDVVQPTKCRIARTADELLVLFECSDDAIDNIAKGITARDGQTWDNESVEIFLDPTGDRKSYYQFTVGCSGALYDGIGWSSTYDAYWEARTSIGANGWIAEIRIPFSALGEDAFRAGSKWAANFNRFTRPTYAKELSGWSVTGNNTFHQAERFGTLTGITVNPNNYPYSTSIEISSPKGYYLGNNTIEAVVTRNKKPAAEAVLSLIDLANRKSLWTGSISASDKAVTKYRCEYVLESKGVHEMQFVLKDKKSSRILASSKVFRPKAEPDLSLNINIPVVRDSVQSKDRIKKLVVDGDIGYTSAEKLYIECTGTDSQGKRVSNVRRRVHSHSSFNISVDVRKYVPGKYSFEFKLLENDRQIAAQTIPLKVAAPAAVEVSFDDRRVCYVNGKPFFPIGLYHVTGAAVKMINEKSRLKGLPELDIYNVIKEIKNRGFNTVVHSWGMPDDKYMEYTQSLGLWVMPEVQAPTAEMVAMANRYNNLLMWYGVDEPAGEKLNMIRDSRAQTAILDPNRPVSAAVVNPSYFKDALAGFDFIMMDPYLIRHAPLSGIADWVKRGLDASNGTKPVWLVPQAFTCDSPIWNEPTPEELKCQAYIGLVNGATGLVWYAFFTHENWSDSPIGRGYWVLSDSKLWDAFPKLNAEINQLAPVVLTGQNMGPAKCSSKDIQSCVWKYRGKTYVLTVNTLYTAVKCKLSGIGSEAEVLFENRKATSKNGVLEEIYKPLEVHVYKF